MERTIKENRSALIYDFANQERWSFSYKREIVRIVDTNYKRGISKRQSCRDLGIWPSIYYKYKEDLETPISQENYQNLLAEIEKRDDSIDRLRDYSLNLSIDLDDAKIFIGWMWLVNAITFAFCMAIIFR